MLLMWPLAVLTASLGRSDLWLAGVHRQPEDERERGGDRDQARPGGDRECVRGRMAGEGREEDRSQGGATRSSPASSLTLARRATPTG